MQERSAPQENNGKLPATTGQSGSRSPGSNASTTSSVQSTRRPLTSSEGQANNLNKAPPATVINETPKRIPTSHPAKKEFAALKLPKPAAKSPVNTASLYVGGKIVEFNLSPVKGELPELAKASPLKRNTGGSRTSKEAEDIMRTPSKKNASRPVPIGSDARRPLPLFSSHSAAALSTPPSKKGTAFSNQCIAQSAPGRYSQGNLGSLTTPPRILQRQHSVNVTSLRASNSNSRNAHHRRSPPGTFHNTPDADLVVPPLFAGSQFLDSPQAKKLPPPPRQWLDELEAKTNSTSGSINGGNSSDEENMRGSNSTSPTSQLSSISGNSQPASPSVFGVRVNPLTLIAAVAGS
ncbi:hypothetical protein AAVH_05499 [Aphelenchoides avenae]|nr:hypothetical protein AAVH_05499 [Aphelenchus avenae]